MCAGRYPRRLRAKAAIKPAFTMNQRDAEAIAAPLEAAIGQLSKALSEAEVRLDARALESFRRLIGIQVGNLSHQLLDPIYAEHPSLMPESSRD